MVRLKFDLNILISICVTAVLFNKKFDWNFVFPIESWLRNHRKNLAEVVWGLSEGREVIKNLSHASRLSTSAAFNNYNNKRLKEQCLKIVVLSSER